MRGCLPLSAFEEVGDDEVAASDEDCFAGRCDFPSPSYGIGHVRDGFAYDSGPSGLGPESVGIEATVAGGTGEYVSWPGRQHAHDCVDVFVGREADDHCGDIVELG